MVTVNLEQRARELLAAEYERDGKAGSADHIRTQPLLPNKARAVRAIAAALRQQPAPAELSEVTRQLIERDRRGRAKYGTSLDRTDLSLPDWLQHMAEELLDAAGYALAAKRTAHQPAPMVDDGNGVRACPVLIAARAHDVGTTGVLRGNADLVPAEHTYLTTRPENNHESC